MRARRTTGERAVSLALIRIYIHPAIHKTGASDGVHVILPKGSQSFADHLHRFVIAHAGEGGLNLLQFRYVALQALHPVLQGLERARAAGVDLRASAAQLLTRCLEVLELRAVPPVAQVDEMALRAAWCQGQVTCTPLSTPSARGPP